jgi:hypothetical protein
MGWITSLCWRPLTSAQGLCGLAVVRMVSYDRATPSSMQQSHTHTHFCLGWRGRLVASVTAISAEPSVGTKFARRYSMSNNTLKQSTRVRGVQLKNRTPTKLTPVEISSRQHTVALANQPAHGKAWLYSIPVSHIRLTSRPLRHLHRSLRVCLSSANVGCSSDIPLIFRDNEHLFSLRSLSLFPETTRWCWSGDYV